MSIFSAQARRSQGEFVIIKFNIASRPSPVIVLKGAKSITDIWGSQEPKTYYIHQGWEMEERELEKMGLFPIGQSYINNCLRPVSKIPTYSFVVRVKYSIITTLKNLIPGSDVVADDTEDGVQLPCILLQDLLPRLLISTTLSSFLV